MAGPSKELSRYCISLFVIWATWKISVYNIHLVSNNYLKIELIEHILQDD